MVHTFAKGDILCQFLKGLDLVKRIIGYPGTYINTPVNWFWHVKNIRFFASYQLINVLRYKTNSIEEESLGIKMNKIGMNSIISIASIMVYLEEVSV